MANFKNYPIKAFSTNQKFLADDPNQVVRVTGQSMLDAAVAELGSIDLYTQVEFTNIATQTTITIDYLVGLVDVLLNGVHLASADYAATNGSSIELTDPVISSADIVTVIRYAPSSGLIGTGTMVDKNAKDYVARLDSVADIQGLIGFEGDQQISLKGWHPDSDVGGGVLYWDSAALKSTHNGGTIFSPTVPWTTTTADYLNAVGETDGAGTGVWVRNENRELLVSWGLKANDAAAGVGNKSVYDKAISVLFSLTGGLIIEPEGNIYITGTISFALSAGWVMTGSSRLGTKLIQNTDNTPHFDFPVENIHSWGMTNKSFSWLNQQTTSHTSAHALDFNATSTGAGCYLFKLDEIFIEKGFSLITTTGGALIWGYNFGRISIGGSVIGQVLNASSGVSGQPSAEIDYLYVDAANITEPVLEANAANGFNIRTLEIVGGGKAPALKFTSSILNIRTLKCEAWSIDAPTMTGRGLIEHQNTAIDIENVQCDLRATAIGAGNDLFLFKNIGGSPNGDLTIRTLNMSPATPIVSGDMLLTNNQGEGGRLFIKSINNKIDFLLSDTAATDAANWSQIEEYLNNFQSADNGDADVVLDFGDQATQQFNTTLTAGRTVTLPGPRTGNTDCFNGLKYTIVRNAGTPGAFTLSVLQDGGGTLIVIPINTNMIIEYTFRRNSWELTNKVTL